MELSLKSKIIILCFVAIMLGIMLWLHREALLANIYTDYAIEPFENQGACEINALQPTILHDSFGQ